LQIYYDGYHRHEEGGVGDRKTLDLDFDHHLIAGSRHDIVWGLGYRVTEDNISPKYSKSFLPAKKTDNLFSAFLQDEIKVMKSVWFIAGSKLEHNAYTRIEFEPSAQVVWQPATSHTLWVSAARAIRQPGPGRHRHSDRRGYHPSRWRQLQSRSDRWHSQSQSRRTAFLSAWISRRGNQTIVF
jgi:iron complex outermembrane receptor protein